jgi:hypothetical protein
MNFNIHVGILLESSLVYQLLWAILLVCDHVV